MWEPASVKSVLDVVEGGGRREGEEEKKKKKEEKKKWREEGGREPSQGEREKSGRRKNEEEGERKGPTRAEASLEARLEAPANAFSRTTRKEEEEAGKKRTGEGVGNFLLLSTGDLRRSEEETGRNPEESSREETGVETFQGRSSSLALVGGCLGSSALLSSVASRKRTEGKEEESDLCKREERRTGEAWQDELGDLREEIFFALRDVRDPEFPVYTLGDLGVVTPELIHLERLRTGDNERSKKRESGRRRENRTERRERLEEEDGCVDLSSSREHAGGRNKKKTVKESSGEAASDSSPIDASSETRRGRERKTQERNETDKETQGRGEEEEDGKEEEGGGKHVKATVCLRPTNARCSMASLIGLAVRCKICERFASVSPDFFSLLRLFEKIDQRDDFPREEMKREEDWTGGRRNRRGRRKRRSERQTSPSLSSSSSFLVTSALEADGNSQTDDSVLSPGEEKNLFSSDNTEEEEEEAEGGGGGVWLKHVDLCVVEHEDEGSLTRQLNDKERISAALENPSIRLLVLSAISEDEDLSRSSFPSSSSSLSGV